MLLQIRKTGEGTYEVDGNSYFISGIAAFVISFFLCLLFTWQFLPSLLWSFALTLFVMPFVYWHDQAGKKKHQNLIRSKLFAELKQLSLEEENVKDYWALIGEYQNYCVRIYYDWNKRVSGLLSFGDIVLMVYYQPVLVLGSHEEIDVEKLDEMNLPVRDRFWAIRPKRKYIRFTPNHLLQHIDYYPFTSAKQIIPELDSLIQLAQANQLKPMSKEEVEAANSENGYFFAPQIETFEFKK